MLKTIQSFPWLYLHLASDDGQYLHLLFKGGPFCGNKGAAIKKEYV
jgi:hypothetical protein